MISDLILKCAKVVSIDDPDKQGKIQINIESEFDFENATSDLYPWAIPFLSNTSDSSMEMHLPTIDSKVWILVDKYYKRFYYITNRYFYNLFDFSKVSGLLDKCEKINTEYKNIDFKYYEDGTLIFHNNSDSSSGIITSTGTIIYLDKDGNLNKSIKNDEITTINKNKNETVNGTQNTTVKKSATFSYENTLDIKCKREMNFESSSKITMKSKTNSIIEIGNAIGTLGSLLNELCTDLSSLTTVSSTGLATSPTLTAQMSVLMSKIKMIFK